MAKISKDEKLVLYRRELLSKGYRIISGKIFDKNNEEIKYQDFRAKLMCEYAEPVSFIEDLIDEFSEDNFEEVLANFQNYSADYNNLVERKIKSICYDPRFYIDKDCFEIEKL